MNAPTTTPGLPAVLPALPADLEPTRATLHAYAHAVGAVPRIHAVPHPKWWHISLGVRPTGFVTDPMVLLDGSTFDVLMDLTTHEVVVATSTGTVGRIPMDAGLSGTELGERLIAAVSGLGLEGDYDRDRFANDEPRSYDRRVASGFLATMVAVDRVLEAHRASVSGSVGPVQIWPHGFDIAFEWFGTRMVGDAESDEGTPMPSQINLGFYPAGDAYFYTNPWPFESDVLLANELPGAAEWHVEGWEGSTLPFAEVADRPDGAAQVLAYAAAVHDIAAPTLTSVH